MAQDPRANEQSPNQVFMQLLNVWCSRDVEEGSSTWLLPQEFQVASPGEERKRLLETLLRSLMTPASPCK